MLSLKLEMLNICAQILTELEKSQVKDYLIFCVHGLNGLIKGVDLGLDGCMVEPG